MENEAASLDELLNAPAEDVSGPPRDEHGRFAPQEPPPGDEPVAETPQPEQEGPPPSEPQHVPLAALKDERDKRQQMEQQLHELNNRLQQYDAYFQQQAQPTIDEDPIAFVAQAVREQLAPQLQQELLQVRVQTAEAMARGRWADYDDKIELFKAEAQRNPFLLQQLQGAPDPATYAYNVANQIAEAQRYGGQAPSREQIEAELREKIMQEIGIPQRQAPVSLANERNVGSRGGPAWSGPAPLEDLLRS